MRIIAKAKALCLQIPAALTVVAAIGITGVFIFQVGKTSLSVTQGVWEKTEESINDLASYLDFQSASDARALCAHVGGVPTWQPYGNATRLRWGYCSEMTPEAMGILEAIVKDAYIP